GKFFFLCLRNWRLAALNYAAVIAHDLDRRQSIRGRELIEHSLPLALRSSFDGCREQRSRFAQLLVLQVETVALLLAHAHDDVFRQASHPFFDRSIEEEIRERRHRGDRQQAQTNEVDQQSRLNTRARLTLAAVAPQP